MQTLPFDPALGSAIPLPKNFTIEKQSANEIVIIGQKPDTSDERNHHIRITFTLQEKGYIHRHCLKQEKSETFHSWRSPPEWRKSGKGSKCNSDWVIKCLLQGTFS